MSKIAVIKTGGKQYKVKAADKLKIEKLPEDAGQTIKFDEVLMLADSESGETQLGTPLIKGAVVEAKIVHKGRNKKTRVVKYKSKTRQKTVRGHRQSYTKVEITKI